MVPELQSQNTVEATIDKGTKSVVSFEQLWT